MASSSWFGSRLDRFSRRRFLGQSGAAVMIGLPILEALRGRGAYAQVQAAPQRLVCVGSGNGMPMDEFIPQETGLNYTMGRVIQSLEPIQHKVSLFSGLGIDEGKPRNGPGDHGAGVAVTFTCVSPQPTHANTNSQDYTDPGEPFRLGESFDQVMAKQLGNQTRISSLQLGLREGGSRGDGPFSPVYLKNLSWASPTEPLSPIVEPGAVFEQLFAGFDPAATSAENARRLAQRVSVLDYVAAERELLMPALSEPDRQRMEQFFTATREMEQRLAAAPAQGEASCEPGAKPSLELSYPDTMTAMSDLIVLAMQCDVTRIFMLQLSCYRNDNYFDFLNVSNNHHSLSHAANQRDPDSDFRKVCYWLGDQLGELINKIDAVVEPDGTLLDNALVVYNNDCGAGDKHDHNNLPVLVAGTARGNFPTGRHYSYPSNTPCNSLYVTMLDAMGVQIETFGEKQAGPLDLGV